MKKNKASDMRNAELLEKIGLGKNESAIYVALVDLGPSTISKVSEKTAIHRPLIYKAIPNLEDKKLITSIPRGKQTLYVAEPPNKLEAIFDDLKGQFFDMIPSLEDAYSKNSAKPRIRFLEGKDGIQNIYTDIIATLGKGDIFYRYSSAKDLQKAKEYHPKNYEKMRDAKKLERKAIMAQSKASLKKAKLDRFVKSIPEELAPFDFNVTKLIYGSKIAYINYESETAIIIENELIANFEKSIFTTLYKKLD